MNEKFIRFMALVNGPSTQKLLQLVDHAVADGANKIHLLLNSPGGSVFHGMAVYNYLKGLKGVEVITYNFGTVDSIGVIMYCAGSKRVSVPHARFLLHLVSTTVNAPTVLDEHSMIEIANSQSTDQQNIANIIGATTGKHADVISKLMQKRTTLNTDQAKKNGLVQDVAVDLVPAEADLYVVQESDADLIVRNPMPQMQLSNPPLNGETNLYTKLANATKSY